MARNNLDLVEFGSIMKMVKGKKPLDQSSNRRDGFVPYINIKAFEKGEIEQFVHPDRCITCNEDDLLIVCDGSRSGLVGRAREGVVGSTLAKIHAVGLINDYLYYFLQWKYEILNTRTKGTGTPHIDPEVLASFRLVIPDSSIQKLIVKRIEELLSELDKGEETLQTIKKQLEIYRQAVLKEAFEGKFTSGVSPIYKTLNEFIEKPRYGTSKKCTHEKKENSTLVIRIPNIDTNLGIITYHDVKYAIFDFKELETLDLQEGDLLVIRSNGSVSLVGRTAYVRDIDQGNTFAGYLIRLRIKDRKRLSPKYLQLYLSSFKARVYFEGVAKSTSGVNNINAQEISNISLPYIGITQQELIIKEIESRLSVCDYIEQMVDSAIEQADALRKSILKHAFEGRLT